ncbi:MAG: glutamate racemase, partial [Candidatus Omnitrophica bacterium]|nr:glutamate racemase [Candidatus Omnitrophota bacterium]
VRRNVKALVVACNSSSSAAYSYLKSNYRLPIVDAIRPTAERVLKTTRNRRIGVIATQATVASRAYEKAITKLDRNILVFSQACPLLVPFVEEGVLAGSVIEVMLKRYLKPLLRKKIDTLILGCTHYPMLRRTIQKLVGPKVKLIDSAPAAVEKLREVLEQAGQTRTEKSKGSLEVFVSDLPRNFIDIGARFLGEPLNNVRVVRFKIEVTRNGKWTL